MFNPLEAYQKHRDNSSNPAYTDRAGRNKFAASLIAESNFHKIINIGGGGKRHLEKSLNDKLINDKLIEVMEVDIVGDCDLILDLDNIERLPFDDNSFDAACAFDVLEHLENFHLICAELLRVASREVLISLPVSSSEVFGVLIGKTYSEKPNNVHGLYSKYYGLPLTNPGDRHRWWLYFDDIVGFFDAFARENNCSLDFFTHKPRTIKQRLARIIFSKRIYNNFFCSYLWVRLSKNN